MFLYLEREMDYSELNKLKFNQDRVADWDSI